MHVTGSFVLTEARIKLIKLNLCNYQSMLAVHNHWPVKYIIP